MKNTKISDFLYYPALALIILVSFLNFSALFFPLPDVNTAITILMTPGYSIFGGLYLWGQNFAGNLVPFLAKLLVTTYRFPPDMAVSIVHYGIIVAGFLAVSTLFRSRYIKLLLAIAWFYPSWYFLGHLTSIFGLQMSLLVIGIYMLRRHKNAFSQNIQLLWLSMACITFILAIWVSDLSVISLIALLLFLLWDKKNILKGKNLFAAIREKSIFPKVIVILFFIVAGIGFLVFAKHTASRAETYNHPLLNNPSSLFALLKIIFSSLFNVLIFASHNIIGSIYAWSLIIGVPAILALSDTKVHLRSYLANQRWLTFFLLNGLIIFICLVFSNWVLTNDAAGKYFSVVFISFWIALLLFFESTESGRPGLRKIIILVILVLGIASSLSPIFLPKYLPSKSSALSELKSLHSFGLIGESYMVYIAASTDPKHIKGTPHEGEFIRNANLVKDVFKQDKIYLLGNNWLSGFPDTIRQFGILLQRAGEPFQKSGYDLCRYEKMIKRTIFPVDSMKTVGTIMTDTTAYSGKSAMITIPFDRSRHFIYGPFINLLKGKYTVLYRLKISRGLGINNFAVLNISANFGKTILTSRTLRLCDFAKSNNFEEFDVPLEITRDYEGVEFRIMYLGETDLFFDRVILIEQ